VYEVVFTQVLLACKALEAKGACVGLDSEVCGVDVSAEVEFRHEGLGAVGIVAEEVRFGRHILLIV
jgi:diaminopimelate decarboxylase